jgi:hypothetical protein
MRRHLSTAILLALAAGCGQGPLAWQRTIDLGGNETAVAIAHDGAGLYVAFTATGNDPARAGWFVARFDADGAEKWTRSFKEAQFAVPADLCAGPDGCFAVGRIRRDGRDLGLVVAYAPDGAVRWQKAFAIGDRAEINGVCRVDSARIAITGAAGADDNLDLWVELLDAATGATAWSRSFDLAPLDRGHRVAADQRGNLALIAARARADASDILLVKLNAEGDSLWTRNYDSGGEDEPGDLAFDPLGNLIATTTARIGDSIRCVILEYDPDGGAIRKAAWGERAQAEGRAVAVSPAAEVFIGASLRRAAAADKRDLLVFDYRPNATSVWERRHSAGADCRLADIAVAGDLFAAATVTGKTGDLLLLRFTRLPVAQRQ